MSEMYAMPLLYVGGVNTRKQNMCHAPFISDYSRASKCLLMSTHDVALEQYHIVLIQI